VVNLDLLKEIHQKITTTPEGWDQEVWAAQRECGTSYCIAGWACVLSGYKVNFENAEPDFYGGREVTTLDNGEYIDAKASELLGLDDWQANVLFYSTSNPVALERLEAMIKDYERRTKNG
jgi:hypothetical protein